MIIQGVATNMLGLTTEFSFKHISGRSQLSFTGVNSLVHVTETHDKLSVLVLQNGNTKEHLFNKKLSRQVLIRQITDYILAYIYDYRTYSQDKEILSHILNKLDSIISEAKFIIEKTYCDIYIRKSDLADVFKLTLKKDTQGLYDISLCYSSFYITKQAYTVKKILELLKEYSLVTSVKSKNSVEYKTIIRDGLDYKITSVTKERESLSVTTDKGVFYIKHKEGNNISSITPSQLGIIKGTLKELDYDTWVVHLGTLGLTVIK